MIQKHIRAILSLIKYKVSIAVTFTGITGYLCFSRAVDYKILALILGVFLLAGGSSALNEFQEWKFDANMDRTKNRPIPTGALSPAKAMFYSLSFIVKGTLVLYFAFGLTPALLGLFNIVWYNLIYTNLKRSTPFAVVPGSLVGAVPAFIGWTAAGGAIFDPTIVFIAFFMFIWQVPHFWLLMLKYGKEYEKAGFPTINQEFNDDSLKRIIFIWILATSVTSLFVPLFLKDISVPFFLMIFLLNVGFMVVFTKLAFAKSEEFNFRKSFISINIYMMIFMIMLIAFHTITAIR